MDATQINIKINQNMNLSKGKPDSVMQKDTSASTFNQILTMFNIAGETPNQGGNQAANLMEKGSDTDVTEKDSTKSISPEVMSQLASMLTALISGGTQQQQGSINLEEAIKSLASNPQVLPADIRKAFSQLLQTQSGIQLSNQGTNGDSIGSLQTTLVSPNTLEQNKLDVLNTLEQNQSTPISSDVLNTLGQNQSTPLSSDILNILEQNQSTALPAEVANTLKQGQSSTPMLTEIQNLLQQIAGNNTSSNNQPGITANPLQVVNKQDSKSPVSLDKSQVVPTYLQTIPNGLTGVNTNNESTVQSLPVTQVVPEVTAMAGRLMNITSGQLGSTEAKFRLFPEHLGPVEIKVTTQDGQVSAQIVTSTSAAKSILEGQVQNLREALLQQGVLVQKLDIVQQASPSYDASQASLSFSQQGGGSDSSFKQRSYTAEQEVSKKKIKENPQDNEVQPLPMAYGTPGLKTAAASIDFTA